MSRQQFKCLLSSVSSLTRGRQQRLLDTLKTSLDRSNGINFIETRLESINSCPHCGASRFQRWGKRQELQRIDWDAFSASAEEDAMVTLLRLPFTRSERKSAQLSENISALVDNPSGAGRHFYYATPYPG